MEKMQSLLERQLKKFFGGIEGVPDEMKPFVASINDTYREFDTDREMLERSLELSSQEMLQTNAEMRALFQALPDHLLTLDADGTIISFKTGRIDDLFISSEKVLGKRIYDIFQKQVRDQFRDAFSRMTATNSSISLEYSLTINGAYNVYEARFVQFLEDRSIVIIRNITERKRAEEALLESESQLQRQNKELVQTKNVLQNILNSSVDVIITADLRGNILYSSPAIKKVTGHEQDEIRGEKAYRFYSNGKEDAKKIMKELADKDELRDYEMTIKRKDGELIDISVSFSLVVDEKGEIIGTLGIFRDITDRKKLEVQLVQAQKMEAIGTLAGGIAHDFNNLLMGIQGYTSLMLLDLDEGHPHHDRLKNIEEQVRNGSNLTRQLLGFARGGRYEVRPANLNEVAEETAAMFGRARKEIRIKGRYAKDLWTVKIDHGQIQQVLLNLYVNAFHAMPGGGELFLETENVSLDKYYTKPHGVNPGDYVRLSVTDTGSGMDEGTMKRIFEPFFTTKEMGRGTGLGLASAYGIVKGHGGIINVYSEKGYGTTFNIYLPASKKDMVIAKMPPEKIFRGGETILLVDDEKTIVDVNKEMLEKLGYEVLTANSGREAIEVYKENQNNIKLVLLDMIMPGMSGGETYDKLKLVEPGVKVILSSGYSISGAALKIMERGCRSFLQKPFRIEYLSRTIREVLDSR